MKALFLACLLSCWRPSAAAQPTTLLQQFMLELASKQSSNNAMEEKYFCPALLQRQSAAGDKVRAVADQYLTVLRNQLSEQKVNPAEIQFTPFNILPNKEFELIGDSRYVYAAQYHGTILCYFLLKGDKIDSFLLLNQEGRAYFISFCE